jgi:hypothetical protein
MNSSNEEEANNQVAIFGLKKEIEANHICVDSLENKLIEVTEQRDEYKSMYESLYE